MLDMMYRETQGIVVLAVVLYALVQEEAILSEKETFEPADVGKTARKRMALVTNPRITEWPHAGNC